VQTSYFKISVEISSHLGSYKMSTGKLLKTFPWITESIVPTYLYPRRRGHYALPKCSVNISGDLKVYQDSCKNLKSWQNVFGVRFSWQLKAPVTGRTAHNLHYKAPESPEQESHSTPRSVSPPNSSDVKQSLFSRRSGASHGSQPQPEILQNTQITPTVIVA